MFTGIIENIGKISERRISGGSGELIIETERVFENLQIGESIAVNGVCLSLEKFYKKKLVFHALKETFERTNLLEIPQSSQLNLERSLSPESRMGGHFVTGHIDSKSLILDIKKTASDFEYKIDLPPSLSSYLAPKGSIAVDGISLTIVELKEKYFTVHIIPITREETALSDRRKGDYVNLESDILAKYVFRHLSSEKQRDEITAETLQKAGFYNEK